MTDNDDWFWQPENLERLLGMLAEKGVLISCGQRWSESSRRYQTAYRLAPGVTLDYWRLMCAEVKAEGAKI
jgi:hypothetical protein